MNASSYVHNLLIVDDNPANLRLLSKWLDQDGYKIRAVINGQMALTAARTTPPDLVLLDINMPDMDGYEVCKHLKEDQKLKDIPVIFVSALSETIDKVKAFSCGGVDYIAKPFHLEEVKARVETHLQLRRLRIELEDHVLNLQKLVDEQVKEISDSQMATIIAMAKMAELRDDATGEHIERVQILSKQLSIEIGKSPAYHRLIDEPFIENIFQASSLHDIGKVGISDSILLKPGKLTPDEFEIMKKHTVIGSEKLKAVQVNYPKNTFIQMGITITRSHHEKWNGSGYPDGLAGEDIPVPARIVAIVDVYDALRSKRPYKIAMSHEESCQIIKDGSGSHFDPEIVKAFCNIQEVLKTIPIER